MRRSWPSFAVTRTRTFRRRGSRPSSSSAVAAAKARLRLADAFLSSLRRDGHTLVLSGRCYDRESVPYKAIDPLMDAVVSFLRSRPHEKLDDWLPEDIHLLASLFPILKRVDAIAARSKGSLSHLDERQIRYRGFFALKGLLSNIGQSMPIALFIDDLQWGDGDSAEVLIDLLAPPDPPQVMLLGSYRSDEAEKSSFLQEWNRLIKSRSVTFDAIDVKVEPLSAEECLTLLADRVGLETEQVKQQAGELFEDTQGNPYFLEQLIEGFDPNTGKFTPIPLHEIIDRKLIRLPAESAELLNVIAIAGQAVSIEEASRVAGHATALYSTITHMRSERLVRLIGSTDQQLVDTYHDKIRETTLDEMSDRQRERRHLQLAEAVEAEEGLVADDLLASLSASSTPGEYDGEVSPRVFDLAHHFSQAKDRRAFVYQLLAAEQSLKAYAIEDALEFYRQAERLLREDSSATLQYRFSLSMAQVLLWNQHGDEATEKYKRAANLATNQFDRARAYAGIGHVRQHGGQFDEAISYYDDALAELNVRRPKSLLGKLMAFAAKSFCILVVPASWQRAKGDCGVQNALLKHDLFEVMARCVSLEKSFLDCINGWSSAVLSMFNAGGARHLAIAHAESANVYSGMGLHWLGNFCLKRSARVAAETQDPALRGLLLMTQGHGSYFGGDPIQAQTYMEQAIPFLRRSNSISELIFAFHSLRHARSYVSDSSSELSAAKAELKLSMEIGNPQSICWGSYNVAGSSARAGDLVDSLVHSKMSNSALSGERYVVSEAVRAATDAYVMLQCSEFRKARELSLEAWETTRKSFFFIDQSLLFLPIVIESIAGPTWQNPLEEADRGEMKKALRWSKILYQVMPNHQPHLRRVHGRAYWAMGRQRRAIRQFQKAIRLSQQKGMDYQRAKSLLDLAAVQAEAREENRSEAIKLLKNMESVIPRAEGWLLGDQYDEQVVAPEFDLDAWERLNGDPQRGNLTPP